MKIKLAILALFAVSGSLFADGLTWAVDAIGDYGSLNLTTGAFNQISTFSFPNAGLGEVGASLYTAVEGGTTLYSVNPYTGATQALGDGSISYYAFGSTTTGLYMVDTVGGLWSINPTTGATTLVGSTFINVGSNSLAVSTGSNVLYVASGSDLYTINTSTGQGTLIGSTTATDFGALTTVNGTLYGSSIINNNESYSINPSNAASVFLANLNTPDYLYGAAPTVPEPSSLALLTLAAAIVLVAYPLHRHRQSV